MGGEDNEKRALRHRLNMATGVVHHVQDPSIAHRQIRLICVTKRELPPGAIRPCRSGGPKRHGPPGTGHCNPPRRPGPKREPWNRHPVAWCGIVPKAVQVAGSATQRQGLPLNGLFLLKLAAWPAPVRLCAGLRQLLHPQSGHHPGSYKWLSVRRGSSLLPSLSRWLWR